MFVIGAVPRAAGRGYTPPPIPWIVAGVRDCRRLSFEWEVWVDPTALGVVYILLAMLAFGPFTFSLPVMVGGCRRR